MSEWKKVKIGDFLEQYRNTIYIDDSVEYGQITISSKNGVKYRCSKSGKEIGRKRQFVIDLKTHPNTVIFTRQGIADGSIGIAPQEVDGCIATENMPMFSVNEDYILIDYLRYLFISPTFRNLIATITPTGSAQKAIHERELLPLEISIPDLQTQQEIVKKISSQLQKAEQVSIEIESQKYYIKQLRQNILQEAIEGKLTADWRKQNPAQKGNPDYDAEALFKQIQKEKYSEKKQKELSPITDEEKPFEISEGWKWVRLGSIIQYLSDFNSNGGYALLDSNVKMYDTKDYAIMIRTTDFENGFDLAKVKYINEKAYNLLEKSKLFGNEIIMNKIGSAGKTFIMPKLNYPASLGRNAFLIRLTTRCEVKFIYDVLNSDFGKNDIKQYIKGALTKTITKDNVRRLLIPFPPLLEQKEIVTRVEKHLQTVSKLENQITEREQLAKQLMQSILKDAFEER